MNLYWAIVVVLFSVGLSSAVEGFLGWWKELER